jgi:hypothetical protein
LSCGVWAGPIGWGVFVGNWSNVDVCIQDNVFTQYDGNGAITLHTSNVGTRLRAVVARNPETAEGPFIQMLPGLSGGCGLRPRGELDCFRATGGFASNAPLAALVQVGAIGSTACAVRPDRRIMQWGYSTAALPAPGHAFIEATVGGDFCCGLTQDRRAYCWTDEYDLPQE